MAKQYIQLESIQVLSDYRVKLEGFKHELYKLNDENRMYHERLENEGKWSGQAHEKFYEDFISEMYNKFIQPLALFIDEQANKYLDNFQGKAEELGIR